MRNLLRMFSDSFIRRIKKIPFMLLSGAIISLIIMFIGSRLPFVPAWQLAKIFIIAIGATLALTFILIAKIYQWRKDNLKSRCLVVLGAIVQSLCVLFATWVIILDTFGVTSFERESLIQTIKLKDSSYVVFIYSNGGFLNSSIVSRVASHGGFLPFERTLLKITKPLRGVYHARNDLIFSFGYTKTDALCYKYDNTSLTIVSSCCPKEMD